MPNLNLKDVPLEELQMEIARRNRVRDVLSALAPCYQTATLYDITDDGWGELTIFNKDGDVVYQSFSLRDCDLIVGRQIYGS